MSDKADMRSLKLIPRLALMSLSLLSGCDMLGLPNPAKEAAQAEADAKAVGASCRHSGRSLEDCYSLYPDQSRAQIFAGWKEMHDYMAAGNIAVVPPTIPREVPQTKKVSEEEAAPPEDEEPAPKKKSRKKDSASEDSGKDSGKERVSQAKSEH